MKYSCSQWDWKRGHSAYEAKSLSIALLDQISIKYLNIDCFYMSVLLKFICTVHHVVDVVKCFVMYYIFIISLQSSNVLI